MKNINLGLDLSGGVSITYQAVKDNPTDEEMSDTRYKLEQRASPSFLRKFDYAARF